MADLTTEYFNINIVFNELIGSIWLSMIIGLIVIWWITINKSLGLKPGMFFSIIWILIMFGLSQEVFLILYTSVIIGVGGLFYFIFSRKVERG